MAKLGNIDDSKEQFVDEDFANGLEAPDSMDLELNNNAINQDEMAGAKITRASGGKHGFDEMDDSADILREGGENQRFFDNDESVI